MNAILDLFEDNRIPVQDAKIVLWTLLTAIYEDELIEEPQRRETIIENIERQKELARNDMEDNNMTTSAETIISIATERMQQIQKNRCITNESIKGGSNLLDQAPPQLQTSYSK